MQVRPVVPLLCFTIALFSLLALSRAPDLAANRITLGQATDVACGKQSKLKSLNSKKKGTITFINRSGQHRAILWIDFAGQTKQYAALNDGEETKLQTYVTHPWMVTDGAGNCLALYMPGPDDSIVEIDPIGNAAQPWNRPECKLWQRQCDEGNRAACGKHEFTCQVN